ncbi:MAG TPA: hypothetical protein VF575_05430 [Candidatus Saccharimonadales bacterium]|jgi:peptidoglycan hydrolase CwlO-like protein
MASPYEPYYKQALKLEFRYKDIVDDQDNPLAQNLQREIHALVEDLKAEKDPRDVEEQIKTIDRQLLQARAQGEICMSYQDIDQLQDEYRELREDIRELPNY